MRRRAFFKLAAAVPLGAVAAKLGIEAASRGYNIYSGRVPSSFSYLGHTKTLSGRICVRGGLPPVGWRKINEGMSARRSFTRQVDLYDTLARDVDGKTYEAVVAVQVDDPPQLIATIDKNLARLSGNYEAYVRGEIEAALRTHSIFGEAVV